MSKPKSNVFGNFIKPARVQPDPAPLATEEPAATAADPPKTRKPAPAKAKRAEKPRQMVEAADRVQLLVRLSKVDRDRLKEFNLAPFNMTFQQLVITALNYYLEHKHGQKGRPLQTPATYK